MTAACSRSVSGRAADMNALRERINALALGDRTVARDVTSALIKTNHATLLYMSAARHSEAWSELGHAAHRLAGSLRMLQCRRETALALRLERAALEHDALTAVALLPGVTEAITALNEQLDALLA
ncbi:Hpt domain-containing protein [Paraburkholderia hospita]|uniref:Histidine kinase n=2 Tax=Paraburkholderia hospita TaxID=169430 RepID=A0AAN1JGD1_9BURK|nr:Hpt domain-containing protein [Paraburkholderia hospita]AUT72754.1 histidine kinase [Paraburkholderia hospita]EIN01566.1 Hpt domain-containing protein [Paraburkholderia hospita]OUL81612.1 histidine kinase [Paraburkholderia hospita]OUL82965.1 histidine kinase [Paraburkholderia hospita]SEI25087.1 Hpt domain-containing protein [Paraburkholderia hospita]